MGGGGGGGVAYLFFTMRYHKSEGNLGKAGCQKITVVIDQGTWFLTKILISSYPSPIREVTPIVTIGQFTLDKLVIPPYTLSQHTRCLFKCFLSFN